MLTVNPYLVYNGTCCEAFSFYVIVFRGEGSYFTYYFQAPPEAQAIFANAKSDHVMHATLKIDEKTILMGNDNPDPSGGATNNFYVYVDFIDPDEAFRVFDELSDGGKIIVPISKTFWSPCYGVLTDKFGISWKITSH